MQALIASHQIKTWPAIKAMAGVSDQYKEVSAVRVCQAGRHALLCRQRRGALGRVQAAGAERRRRVGLNAASGRGTLNHARSGG